MFISTNDNCNNQEWRNVGHWQGYTLWESGTVVWNHCECSSCEEISMIHFSKYSSCFMKRMTVVVEHLFNGTNSCNLPFLKPSCDFTRYKWYNKSTQTALWNHAFRRHIETVPSATAETNQTKEWKELKTKVRRLCFNMCHLSVRGPCSNSRPADSTYNHRKTQLNSGGGAAVSFQAQPKAVSKTKAVTKQIPSWDIIRTICPVCCCGECVHLQTLTFLPTYTGMPMIMAGMAMPAMRAIPTGAPTSVPSCQRIFFFLLHGFFPQKVQPDGLTDRWDEKIEGKKKVIHQEKENRL